MHPYRLAVPALLAVAAFAAPPASAVLPMRFWVEYAGTGTVAFACHNVAAYRDGASSVRTGTASVSCSFAGTPAATVVTGGSHATDAGLANAALGDTVQVCIRATAVYGLPHRPEQYVVDTCTAVVVGVAGTVHL